MKTNLPLRIRQIRSGYRYVARFCCGTLLLAMTVTSLHSAPTEKPTDSEINAAVVNHLLFDSSVPTNEIDIATSEGIVTLSGTAPNLVAKERATMVAEAIKGVRSVVNSIMVEPIKRTDQELLDDMKAALQADPVTDSYELTPTVATGIVTLTGTVDSWYEKQLAASVAKGVKGVKGVTNDLAVSSSTTRPDSEIAAEIESILKRDVWVEDALIHTEVKDGKVTVTGSVGSVAERHRTQSNMWMAGVKAVDDEGLRVEPWAMTGSMRRENVVVNRSAQEVARAVKDSLQVDPRLRTSNLTVTAANGLVTIGGTVANHKAMRAAERHAKNTAGVRRVRNHLKVRSDVPVADETIARNVKAALVRDPYVDRYPIGVSSVKGILRLSGQVDSHYEKFRAEEVASGITGVTAVNNSLTVDFPAYRYYSRPYDWYDNAPYYYDSRPPSWSWPHSDDAEIKSDIEERLSWSPFVNADYIRVSVNDGIATLAGTVGSLRKLNIATESAYQGGARSVSNKLEIK